MLIWVTIDVESSAIGHVVDIDLLRDGKKNKEKTMLSDMPAGQ